MSEFILPESAAIVDPISDSECTSLGNNTGLDVADGETSCQALTNRLMPLLAQIISDISSGSMTIYANDDSKCDSSDASPTMASMMSRIYRVSDALACILCSYDPTLANLLTSGYYPQVLVGKASNGDYPQWQTPDTAPTKNSNNLVTSNGVYTAIRQAIVSVWHLWEKGDGGQFQYFVNTLSDLPSTGNTNNDYAIVYDTTKYTNAIYKWSASGSSWELQETIASDNMENFAVIHVVKGEYADRGLYWFETGWNIMDADIHSLEQRVTALEKSAQATVSPLDETTTYEIGIVDTYDEAEAISPTTGVTKIVFIKDSTS